MKLINSLISAAVSAFAVSVGLEDCKISLTEFRSSAAAVSVYPSCAEVCFFTFKFSLMQLYVSMRVQTEEWQRFIPGVRMYQGKMTLFYIGEILIRDAQNDIAEPLIYNWEDRDSWKVIIVLPGVAVIPEDTFDGCKNIETVIMSDTVRRIEDWAFFCCKSLAFVRLSRNSEYIGVGAFNGSESLTSMFIPPSCTEIGDATFSHCTKLVILSIPENTQLGDEVIFESELGNQNFDLGMFEDVGPWLDVLNDGFEDVDEWGNWVDFPERGEISLHRICCSINENEASEQIYQVVNEQRPQVLLAKSMIGITPLQYLRENPYLENIDEMKILRRYVLEKLGQVY